MKKLSFILTILILVSPIRTLKSEFIVSAEDERTSFIYLDYRLVKNYFENLNVYPKYFPNLDSIVLKDSIESLWSYKVEISLQKPWSVIFDQIKKETTDSTFTFESRNPERDYLFIKASFTPYSERQTNIKLKIKVRLTREKASDIHFLAGVVGESYINSMIKDKLDDALKTFLEKSTTDLYKKSANISNQK